MLGQEAFEERIPTWRSRRRPARERRGELLQYRPRFAQPPAVAGPETCEDTVTIFHGGRNFFATHEMAECFLAKARRVLDAHGAESVALLHEGGLELLFIADHIPFVVGTAFDHRAR